MASAPRWLPLAVILCLFMFIRPGSCSPAEIANEIPVETTPGQNVDLTLLLDVQVNGHWIGKIGEFTMHNGRLMARPTELRDLGFKVPASLVPDANGMVAVAALPNLTWSVDMQKLVLHVTAVDSVLTPTMLRPTSTNSRDRRVIESGIGLTLNYDTVGTIAARQQGGEGSAEGISSPGGTGSVELRAFSRWGIVSSGWLIHAGSSSTSRGVGNSIRLDSAYTFADVNTLRRYSVGDFITGGLAWTRPVHLEGAQIRSDFSMRPDLITFPLPRISGTAAVPSTVDILTNGNLTVSGQVDAGPFEVPQLPVVSGAGTISMTITNALGQQVTLTRPFYATSSLLAPGLQTLAVQAGLVRRNWGAANNDYGKMAGTAIFRRGLSRKFTIEAAGEGTPGAFMLGAGGDAQIGNLGEVNFSGAMSSGCSNTGAQISLGVQHIGQVFSMGGSATLANRNYRDVASMNGDGTIRRVLSGFGNLYLRRIGSFGAAYASRNQDAPTTSIQHGFAAAQYSQVLSANYALQIRRVWLNASAFENFADTNRSNGFQIGVTIPFGRRSSMNASVTSEGNIQAHVQKSAALVGDWGYDAYVSAGKSNRAFGQVQYKSPVGLYSAGVDQNGKETTVRMESQGAVSWVDGGLFASNTIYDSFAVVDTNPIRHVHVLEENRKVGSTGRSGRLLVPDMRSFDLNHIAIEPTDVPPDVTLKDATRELRPQDRSGVVVKFAVKVSHAALLKLVDEAGVAVPLGSTATLKGSSMTAPVGYDGQVYVEDLNAHNEVTLERPDGRHCTARFDYHAIPGDVPAIGPLQCKEQWP